VNRVRDALRAGDAVSFNTGRGISWASRELLEPLCAAGLSPQELSRLILVAEKGACWLAWNGDHFEACFEPELTLPPSAVAPLLRSVEALEPKVFAVDPDKVAMLTLEFRPRPDEPMELEHERFQEIKMQIADLIRATLRSCEGCGEFEVDVT